MVVNNKLTPEVRKSFKPFLVKQDIHCSCQAKECGGKGGCCPDHFGMIYAYAETGNMLDSSFRPNINWVVECCEGCECGVDCPNRVVQRGRTIPILIFRTLDRGWSIRTLEKIPKNKFVMEYVGMVMTIKESTVGNYSRTYQFLMDGCGTSAAFLVDAANFGNEARFVNHSCSPNLIVRPIFADRYDYRYHRLAFFSKRDIDAGAELTIDYSATTDDKDKSTSRKECRCGQRNCKGWYF